MRDAGRTRFDDAAAECVGFGPWEKLLLDFQDLRRKVRAYLDRNGGSDLDATIEAVQTMGSPLRAFVSNRRLFQQIYHLIRLEYFWMSEKIWVWTRSPSPETMSMIASLSSLLPRMST